MAMCVRFVCQQCRNAVEAWDEGDPYYFDLNGRKKYAYHPSSERKFCTGIDSPHLCLDCGKEFKVDSEKPIAACPRCKSAEIADTFHLNGRRCPKCHTGKFSQDPEFFAVS